MTLSIRAHFDGHTIVPDERIDLPINRPLVINVTMDADATTPPASAPQLRVEAIDRFLGSPVAGATLADDALDRENLYDDRS